MREGGGEGGWAGSVPLGRLDHGLHVELQGKYAYFDNFLKDFLFARTVGWVGVVAGWGGKVVH